MSSVFISYRREDCPVHAGRLRDWFRAELGPQRVFMDVDSIRSGARFSEKITHAIDSSDVVLVLIGPHWLAPGGHSERARISEPRDWVRREVSAAIRSGKPIIPVLLSDARMPEASDLPKDLQDLLEYNAAEINDRHWDYDVERLVADITQLVDRPPETPAAGPVAPGPTESPEAEPAEPAAAGSPAPRWRRRAADRRTRIAALGAGTVLAVLALAVLLGSGGGAGGGMPAGGQSCGSGVSAGPGTSCPFARNVHQTYEAHGGGNIIVTAYSPVTGRNYRMSCGPSGGQHVCIGGRGAAVYFP